MESNQCGRQMGVPLKVTRAEHLPQELRQMASEMKDAAQARRVQTVSFIMDGWTRGEAAEFACVDRQTVRDWVERYNLDRQNQLPTRALFCRGIRNWQEAGMARIAAREPADREEVLWPELRVCPDCARPMRVRYENHRTLETLSGRVRLRLKIRRCEHADCAHHYRPYRPEAEALIALPEHEFGLDVIALVGVLRHRDHRSIPEIHQALRARGVAIAERSVTNLLDRYDAVSYTHLTLPTKRIV